MRRFPELYYLAADGKLMVVGVEASGSGMTAGVPSPLFQTKLRGTVSSSHFAAADDGQRFLMSVAADETSRAPITVVLNWDAEARR